MNYNLYNDLILLFDEFILLINDLGSCYICNVVSNEFLLLN